MAPESAEARRAEFDKHVWNHTTDEFQLSFEQPDELTTSHIEALQAMVNVICDGGDDGRLSAVLAEALEGDETLIYRVLQLTGGTKSKLKTDLEATAAELHLDLKFGGRPDRFVKRPEHWALAQPYLIGRIRATLSELCLDSDENFARALRTVNQATWSGFVRQKRAKLSGHEAERRLALVLAGLGIPFVPADKATTRGAADAHYEGESFDLAVPDERQPGMLVVSGVQSGNIGQFGESKAQDTKNAADMLTAKFGGKARKPVLLAFVDGVGFWGNAAGLRMILESADEFCQFKTLWKAAVIAAALVGDAVTLALPAEEIEAHSEFLDRWNLEAVALTSDYLEERADAPKVDAGEGVLFLEDG